MTSSGRNTSIGNNNDTKKVIDAAKLKKLRPILENYRRNGRAPLIKYIGKTNKQKHLTQGHWYSIKYIYANGRSVDLYDGSNMVDGTARAINTTALGNKIVIGSPPSEDNHDAILRLDNAESILDKI